MYFGARFYDPDLGRMLQADSARENWSLYLYVGNNPIMGTDPTGNNTAWEFQLESKHRTTSQRILGPGEATSIKTIWSTLFRKWGNRTKAFFGPQTPSSSMASGSRVTPGAMKIGAGTTWQAFETYAPGDMHEFTFSGISGSGLGADFSLKKIHLSNNKKEWFFEANGAFGTPGSVALGYNIGTVENLIPGSDLPITRESVKGLSTAWNVDVLIFGGGQQQYSNRLQRETKIGFRLLTPPFVGANGTIGMTFSVSELKEKFSGFITESD